MAPGALSATVFARARKIIEEFGVGSTNEARPRKPELLAWQRPRRFLPALRASIDGYSHLILRVTLRTNPAALQRTAHSAMASASSAHV
jgi:hypothetical protein